MQALDHVVVNARGRLDDAAALYGRLGFALTPLGRHTLGSANHLAVFERDYLELVGIDPDAARPRPELLHTPPGLNGLVFATDDADALYRALAARGAPVEAPAEFSRPQGADEVRFRVVRVAADATPYGRVYFCQHLTRDLVWRDAWRHHPNGAAALRRVVMAAADPEATGALYRRLFGAAALEALPDGLSLDLGTARLELRTHASVAREFGAAPGLDDRIVALTVATRSLDDVRRALAAGGITPSCDEARRVVVPEDRAFGAVLEFVA